ncbi:MAG: hypothetical protein HY303_11230 [Candidatus Wallbacteria bacterium]|nr:hypothetical protein [Candidatus Wallbacteria bacterium]
MNPALRALAAGAVASSLFAPRLLDGAIDRRGFVHVFPIRSPAPAQDLILRLGVEGYRVGDLDRGYEAIEQAWGLAVEDFDPFGVGKSQVFAVLQHQLECPVKAGVAIAIGHASAVHEHEFAALGETCFGATLGPSLVLHDTYNRTNRQEHRTDKWGFP